MKHPASRKTGDLIAQLGLYVNDYAVNWPLVNWLLASRDRATGKLVNWQLARRKNALNLASSQLAS